MRREVTTSVFAPCPGCREPRGLRASVQPVGDGDAVERATLHACTRCWVARARVLNDARARLRATGDLGMAGSVLTWQGEALDPNAETDGLSGALVSELLRRGMAPNPTAVLALPAPISAHEDPAPARP